MPPKPDKNSTKGKRMKKRVKYRPKSLIDVNAKILLSNILKKIIHHDQAEFIAQMQGWFSFQESI